jgi:hypothetical protein
MKKVTRRSVLKSLAKISAVAAATQLMPAIIGCSIDRQILLNVVLHGLFALHIRKTDIELLTPHIDEHIYKVGGWDKDHISCIDRNTDYMLTGVNGETKMPYFDWNQTPTFFGSSDNFCIKYDENHSKINLPFPNSFKLLRCINEKYPQENYPLDGCSSNGVDKYITRISLCQVLTYKVLDYRSLQLIPNAGSPVLPWKIPIDWETHTSNLHLWAEPPKRLTSRHANEAYSRLSCLLPPLRLHLYVHTTEPIDRDTGVCGLPPEEELGWSDWNSGGGEGVHPTNCCAVILQPFL